MTDETRRQVKREYSNLLALRNGLISERVQAWRRGDGEEEEQLERELDCVNASMNALRSIRQVTP